MPEINLRDLYPDQYKKDCFIEVTDAVADVFAESKRSEDATKRKKYRYHAQYSLDQGDGIESAVLNNSPSIEELLEQFETNQAIAEAFKTLTPVQARRIYARFVLKKTVAEIAKSEGTNWNTVKKSIYTGLHKIEKHLIDNSPLESIHDNPQN